eukprot:scaffold6125_cov262-Ochromonas_danica.AAC.5
MQEEIQLLWDLEFHLPAKDVVKEENNEIVSNHNFTNSSDEDHDEDVDEDNSLSRHHSCSSDGVNEYRRTKRRRRLEHYKSMQMTFKRVVKNDVRKLFPTMYCNVLNGDDFKLFERFVCRFMVPKCKFVAHPFPQLDSPYRRYEGPEKHALSIQSLAASLPDHALVPLGSRIIRQLLDENISIVELYVKVKATKLVYYDGQVPDESIFSSNKESSFIPIQPSEALIDFNILASFYFNKDGFVVKTVSSIAASNPSFHPILQLRLKEQYNMQDRI